MIKFSYHSGIYTLKVVQDLNTTISEAWIFFSNPKNLSKITPKQMGFNITSETPEYMFEGQIISYKVSPLLGIKLNWVTEITHVKKGEYFVDEQRFGPYSLWHHKHFLKPIKNGVEMEDIIDYKIPFGLFGQMIHPILVKPKLNEIFKYREIKLVELFGEYKYN